MKKTQWIITACLMAAVLTACAAPAATASAPVAYPNNTEPAYANPEAQATAPSALPTAPAATATSAPITSEPIVISDLHMLDAANGWGWSLKEDGSADLLRTSDSGNSWTEASPTNKELTAYGGFFLDAQTAWLPYFDPASNMGSLLHTTDGGKSWVSFPPLESAQNASYEFSSATEGVAQTAGVGAGNLYLNLFQTSDAGQSWAPVLLTPPAPEPDLPAGTVHLCNICGDSLYYDSARAIIAYGDLANEPAGSVRLAVSSDLGQHWQNLELPFPDAKYADGLAGPKPMRFFGTQGLLPVNIIKYGADGALAYSALVMYSTQDGGQNWSATSGILESDTRQFDAVQILSATDAFVRCGKNLCVTHDGAKTWQTLAGELNFDQGAETANYVSQFNFVNPTTGWAIAGEMPWLSLWQTADGGASWDKLAPRLLP